MITLPEPQIVKDLRTYADINIIDSDKLLIPFLRDQYNYETTVNKGPHHTFKTSYILRYFTPSAMLNYYMDPSQIRNIEYAIDDSDFYPIVLKRKRTITGGVYGQMFILDKENYDHEFAAGEKLAAEFKLKLAYQNTLQYKIDTLKLTIRNFFSSINDWLKNAIN